MGTFKDVTEYEKRTGKRQITLSLEVQDYDAVCELADGDKRSVAAMSAILIDEALTAREKARRS